MKLRKQTLLISGGALIAVIVALHVLTTTRLSGGIPNDTNASSTQAFNFPQTSTSTAQVDSKSTTIFVGDTVATPNYSRPLRYPASITAEVRAAMDAQFKKDVESIKKSNDVEGWTDLAVLRKITEDYTGAAEIYRYVVQMHPELASAYLSLGHIYANYLKDYPTAERYLLKALSINAKLYDAYVELHYMYRGPYKISATAAVDILHRGIEANPKMYQLQIDLARYYATLGRTAEAKSEFDAAIANARSQGMTSVATELEAEKGAL